MRRRPFLTTIALAGVWPAPSPAQVRVAAIGLLDRQYPSPQVHQVLFKRLDELGWVEGRNLKVERRLLTEPAQRSAAAAELAAAGVALVVAPGDGTAQAMHAARASVPIVMPWSISPVRAGLAVETAENGARAVELARGGGFAAILMDMQMPELDGIEATRRIRRLPECADIPIIAMTANAFAEDKARCLAAGMDAFLSKPVEPVTLYATVLAALRGRTR